MLFIIIINYNDTLFLYFIIYFQNLNIKHVKGY